MLEVQSYIAPENRWMECAAEQIFQKLPNLPRKLGTKEYIKVLKQIAEHKPGGGKSKLLEGLSDKDIQDLQDMLNDGVNNHDNWGDTNGAKGELVKNQIDYQAKEVAKHTEKSRGLWPAELTEMLDKLLKPLPPVFNWKGFFRRLLGTAFDIYQKKTRRKESSRFEDSPGLKRKKKHNMLVAIDTSGSVNMEELKEFFSEIYHIWKAGANIHILECDAEITKEYDYTGKMPEKISGRGGTMFSPCIDYYNEHRKEYTTMVYFTDGYGDQDQCKPLNQMLWVITSEGNQKAKFPGVKICIPKNRQS